MKNFVILKPSENMSGYFSFTDFFRKGYPFKLKAVEIINEKHKDTRLYKGRRNHTSPSLITNSLENYLNKLLSLDMKISYNEYCQFNKLISVVEKWPTRNYSESDNRFPYDEITSFWIIFFEDHTVSSRVYFGANNQKFDHEFFDPKEITQNRVVQDNNEKFQLQLDISKIDSKNTRRALYTTIIVGVISMVLQTCSLYIDQKPVVKEPTYIFMMQTSCPTNLKMPSNKL